MDKYKYPWVPQINCMTSEGGRPPWSDSRCGGYDPGSPYRDFISESGFFFRPVGWLESQAQSLVGPAPFRLGSPRIPGSLGGQESGVLARPWLSQYL